jgi:hypothetical protein
VTRAAMTSTYASTSRDDASKKTFVISYIVAVHISIRCYIRERGRGRVPSAPRARFANDVMRLALAS